MGERRTVEEWNLYGNLQAGAGYTQVVPSENEGPLDDVVDLDTISPNHSYKNRFITDGVWGKGMAYVVMESNLGRGIELQAEGLADRWVGAQAKPVTVRYWSPLHTISVGHLQETSSSIFLSGLSVLGAKYGLNLGRNAADAPLVSFDGFYGESRQPFAEGDKNLDLFSQRYSEGGAISQQMTGYGRLSVAPTANAKLHLGAIVSEDQSHDLLVRSDIPTSQELRDPLAQAKAGFVAGEWSNRKGSFQVNLDVAMGQADTADVVYQDAIDNVFHRAGLSSVTLSDVRRVFASSAAINSTDSATIFTILPSDSLTLAQARDSLVHMRSAILSERASLDNDRKKDQVASMDWQKENMATRLELAWRLSQSSITVNLQSVGSHYFSPGASSLTQNSRDYGIEWTQAVLPFWDLDASYNLIVENAAGSSEGEENWLGLGEGSSAGLSRDNAWHKEHLMDPDRAKFTHLAGMQHQFRIGDALDLSVGYSFEHGRQFLPKVLKANFSSDAAVFRDSWFSVRTGKSSSVLDLGFGDSVEVDSSRYATYQALASEDSIAWGYQDVRSKHQANAEIQIRRSLYTLRVGGEWAYQLDQGQFTENDLVADFDFADTTWEKLGQNPQAQTWMEQAYPITLTGTLGRFTNKAGIRPRWKFWQKADLHEFEYRLTDRFEVSMLKRKMVLSLTGEMNHKITNQNQARYFLEDPTDSVRYSYYTLDGSGNIQATNAPAHDAIAVQGGEDAGITYKGVKTMERVREVQTDLSLEGILRINLSTRAFTELMGKVNDVRRPQQLSEEYRDFTGGVTLFYSF
jgi:hypothetical protein